MLKYVIISEDIQSSIGKWAEFLITSTGKRLGDYMKNKKNLFNILFLLLVFGLTMHYVFHGEDLNALGSYLSQADIRYWLAGVVLVVIFILSESVIIYYMMRSVGQNVILTHCFLYSFVGFFFSAITPSATGGQPAQTLFYEKR